MNYCNDCGHILDWPSYTASDIDVAVFNIIQEENHDHMCRGCCKMYEDVIEEMQVPEHIQFEVSDGNFKNFKRYYHAFHTNKEDK